MADRSKYQRDRRKNNPVVWAKALATSSAQQAAKTRLTKIYPEVYAALYAEEKARIFAERGIS